jgi:hypothetical protein
MKVATIFFLIAGNLLANTVFGSKVYTVNNGDWGNAFTWNTGQLPVNPDTILIKHYVTFSQHLIIAAPGELIVESAGPFCGDFELDVQYGARLSNYGHIYVNSAKFRDAKNYNQISSKNSITISGCSQPGYGTGFIDYGPIGITQVWPPVLCKTTGTNWERGWSTAVRVFFDDRLVLIAGDPFNSGTLLVSAGEPLQVQINDLSGREIWTGKNLNSYSVSLGNFTPGLYFIKITANNWQTTRMLLVP